MADLLIGIGEDHAPGDVSWTAPKLTIVEIGKTPQQHSHRNIDRDVIAHPQEAELTLHTDKGDRRQHTEDAAVEAHPTIPKSEQPPGHKAVARKVGPQARIVERCVAQAPAKNHAKCAIEEQIIGVPLRHWGSRSLDHLRCMPIGKDDPEQIGQRVESQSEEAEIDPWAKAKVFPVNRICCAACSK